ncbi:MAG: hypothetical protein WC782_10360 [Methylococcaceae bacterium]|jgi:hypothetical protein
MLSPDIGFAKLTDADAIMQFMHAHWRKGHILSVSKALLLYEFQEAERLNFGIAKNAAGDLLGLFGFIKYNQLANPDIAGSLWKVTDAAQMQYPMLGLQLRNFVVKQVPHRFFAAPGAGLQTKPIYQVLRMNWQRMSQWYWLNPDCPDYQLADIKIPLPQSLAKPQTRQADLTMEKISSVQALASFDFNAQQTCVPFKDLEYIRHRFFDYPYYKYDVWVLKQAGEIKNIVASRRATFQGHSAYRIVDFLGDEAFLPAIIQRLKQEVQEKGDEFLDFITHGINEKILQASGLTNLDFADENLIIPNFFEPLVKKNVPVYCVSDQTALNFRQFKADGDQDRPNYTYYE